MVKGSFCGEGHVSAEPRAGCALGVIATLPETLGCVSEKLGTVPALKTPDGHAGQGQRRSWCGSRTRKTIKDTTEVLDDVNMGCGLG